MSQPTKRLTVVIGVCLPRDVYDAFSKKVPKSKRDRSKIITLLIKKYLAGDVSLSTTY